VDDGWLEQRLYAIHEFLDEAQDRSTDEEEIHLLLDVFLYRRKERLPSLWKRLDEFLPFAQGIRERFRSRVTQEGAPEWPWEESREEARRIVDELKSDDPFGAARFATALQAWVKVRATGQGMTAVLKELEGLIDSKRRIMLVIKPFVAYRHLDIGRDDKRTGLDELSSLVRNLNRMWFEGMTYFAFSRDPQYQPNVEKLGEHFANAVFELLRHRAEAKGTTR
jgi:hypothetical protein